MRVRRARKWHIQEPRPPEAALKGGHFSVPDKAVKNKVSRGPITPASESPTPRLLYRQHRSGVTGHQKPADLQTSP